MGRRDDELLRAFEGAFGTVADVRELVLVISRIPYGRPTEASARGVVADGRGTCSGKHVLLQALVPVVDPASTAHLVHRVYRVTRELAVERWSAEVAATVPTEGLVDVHTYAVVSAPDGRVRVDVTFPISDWDGIDDLPLACGDGTDHPAGDDAYATKRALVARHCDPAVREPFIAALAGERAT